MDNSGKNETMDSSDDEVFFVDQQSRQDFYLVYFFLPFLLHSNIWLSPKEYVFLFVYMFFVRTSKFEVDVELFLTSNSIFKG